jgi:hypothetical protein
MGRRVVVVCVNRYGASFALNKSPHTYKTSGRAFASYYRVACVRCGFPFAQAKWRRHDTKECDFVIRQFKDRDLKRRHIYGEDTP